MVARLSRAATLASIVALLASCVLPGFDSRFGRVSVDFSSASRAAPSNVVTIDVVVKADGMDDINLTLASPSLSADIDVAAGTGRTFEVLARDASGIIRYRGKETLDIVAGTVYELKIAMVAVYALRYDANGADAGTVPAPLYLKAGDPVAIAPNSGGLSRSGFSFDGWNTATNGTGTDYVPAQSIAMPAADLTLYAKWSAVASAKDITAFGFSSPPATGTIIGTNIAVTVPFGTNVTNLVPTITHTGVSVAPIPSLPNDFSSPKVYTVSALDGSTKAYTVTVTIAPSNAKDITAFGFISPAATGVITGTSIAVTVPFGTNVTNLVPSITHTGASVAPIPSLPNDFSSPKVYTVSALDGSTKAYTVTVTITPNSAKDITAFGFSSPPATGVITGTSIAVTVPFGTNVTNLVPSITHTGASVSPNPSLPQDFSATVDYTVTAADASTKVYTVTVTIAPSTNANLLAGGLVLSGITLVPTFTPGTTSYNAAASSAVATVTVTATVAEAGATLRTRINGGAYLTYPSGTPSGALPLTAPAGTNVIEVEVTAPDTVTTKLYTVTIAKTVFLTISSGPGGTVSPASGEFTPGASVPLTATPSAGYRFVNWTGTATVVPMASATANLTVSTVDQTTTGNFAPDFPGGTGTPGDPYLVGTLAELKRMNQFRTSFFRLTANIDLAAESNWLPIGDATTKFSGGLDGAGFALTNLTINTAFDQHRGLFGYVDGAVISDLSLTDIDVVDSYNYAGGLIGTTMGHTQVTNCSVTGTMTAYQSAGGLIGQSVAGSTLEVTDCWTNVAIVTDAYGSIGGLIGYSLGGTVLRCFALGNITETSASDVDQVGGLVGNNENTTITDSYARGSVAGTNNVGGLIGYNNISNVTNSYSTGLVAGSGANPGGLIGYRASSTISSSYYDETTSGQVDTGKGAPLTTAVMKAAATHAATYAGWDFATVWDTFVDGQYPTLR